jgi:hypothetical protein
MARERTSGPPSPAQIRYSVEPRDIPAAKAARRLHLTVEQFREKLPELLRRGFPPPDPTTGNYYLPAIDQWMEQRHRFTVGGSPQNDSEIDRRLAQAWGE